MRINHNISALNAFNQMSKNTALTNKSLQKLSSGLKINSAADDPAGLSISEKMRAQVRGLDQATQNAQDGISLIQTAEGALNETSSILQRMRELAVKAANDTEATVDRDAIKNELDQLAQEITRISDTTKFNGKELMSSTGQFSGDFLIGANSGENLNVQLSAMDSVSLGVATDATSAAAVGEISFVSGDGDELVAGGVDLTGYTQSRDLTIKIEITTAGDGAGQNAIANITINGITREITATDDTAATPEFTLSSADYGDVFESGQEVVLTLAGTPVATDEINLSITGTQSGVESLSVSDNTNAGTTMDAIDAAINTVSAQRSELGAYQNRLEHTINNLTTSSENLTAAESRIRDVDMAKEMVEFTKMNILTQAAQSMLAQANQQPQGVLQLLQ